MFILGKEGPHPKETDNSSVCFRAGGAGGRGSTNDSSPEVQRLTSFKFLHKYHLYSCVKVISKYLLTVMEAKML